MLDPSRPVLVSKQGRRYNPSRGCAVAHKHKYEHVAGYPGAYWHDSNAFKIWVCRDCGRVKVTQ